jgi:hypothetical protein
MCERARMPRDRLRRAALASILACIAAACVNDTKTSPPPERPPDASSLIPTAPAPQPTPTPTPGAVPDEEPVPTIPGGDDDGDTSAGCGEPTPPAVSRINVKLHAQQPDRVILDATPLVGPDVEYCRKVGFTDGRSICAVRPEGDPERQACEAARVGRAEDTGRYGPTWSADGKRCEGPDGGTACLNHPGNQYLVFAYGAGTFRACAASGVCGEIALP